MSFVSMRKRGIDPMAHYNNQVMRGHTPTTVPEISAKPRARSMFSKVLDVVEAAAGVANPAAGAAVSVARKIGRARKRAKAT